MAGMTVLLVFSQLLGAQTKMLRFPDIHGERIVFSYGGDLWTATAGGGMAVRLTSHSGLELFPKFSPDGRHIAFTGQYGGDEQVYVIPARGGQPEQLTWYPARGPLPPRWGYDNQVYGWTPDGAAVLFRSLRDAWSSSNPRLYTVSVDGGLAAPLPMPVAGAGTFAGEADKVFYSPLFRDFRTWKRYQGGWAQSLWLFDVESGEARQATTHPRTDRDPMWIEGAGYFASDRDGKLNLYRWEPDSGEISQLTAHTDWDVRWPSAGPDGRIVYEHNGGLRIFDTRSGEDQGVEVLVPDDGVNRRVHTRKVADRITGAALSPSGKRVLFSARGDLFNAPVEEGITRNLTRRSTAHDREPAWSPDGATIAFISDAGGEEEIHLVTADGSIQPRAVTDGNQTRFYRPRFSPDGQYIAISDKDGYIDVIRADGRGGLQTAGRDPVWRARDYTWSPAGDYLAFSLGEETGMRALHLYEVQIARVHKISEGLFSEYQPVFSPDGKYLYFLADREFSPQISTREWNFATARTTGIYAYILDPDAPNPFAAEDEQDPGIDADDEDSDRAERPRSTHIEFDGLSDRVVRVPVEAGNYSSLFATADYLLFVESDPFFYGREPARKPRLKKFEIDERKTEVFVERVDEVDYSADGKHVLVRRNRDWRVYGIDDNGRESKSVSTARLAMEVDPAAEWATAFDEVWRRFRDHFYVENMHGHDWEVLREQYRPWLAYVAHRADLNYLLGEMISELNVSHAYVDGGDLGLPERPTVALLGVRFELDTGSNRYRIARIFEGQNDEERYRSPLTEAGIEARAGDYVLAINGRELTGRDNPYRHLNLPGGQPVELRLSRRVDGRDSRTVLVEPIDNEQPLLYYGWVIDNRRRVTEATGGRVGYLHIPDMGPQGLREFIKWFYGQLRKDGLVIDVRSNGGGNVSQMLIERLARRPLSLTYARTMPFAFTYPGQAFNGHLVALLNETSASDGDIFPWQFRNAGLGPLIGKRSWGGVVGITDHGPLIDGGTVNVPEFGFADTDGKFVIEGEGVVPDIEVDNDPASVIAGRDRQLERAIEEVMARIEADPPSYPERPADPVKVD